LVYRIGGVAGRRASTGDRPAETVFYLTAFSVTGRQLAHGIVPLRHLHLSVNEQTGAALLTKR